MWIVKFNTFAPHLEISLAHVLFDFYPIRGHLSVRKEAHMSRKIKGNGKHLTFSDRVYIEQELMQGSSFRDIATGLGKDPSTISKEIRLHCAVAPNGTYRFPRCNFCNHFKKCKDTAFLCSTCHEYTCWKCSANLQLSRHCKDYNPFACPKLAKPPYVCNGCEQKIKCHESKKYYRAKPAQKAYEETLTSSRTGINMTPEELKELNDLISPLVLKGQPLSHIFAVHSDEIPVCRRTLYNYFDQSVFQARNIDLPRRVRYKKRKKRLSFLQIRSYSRLTPLQMTRWNKQDFVTNTFKYRWMFAPMCNVSGFCLRKFGLLRESE